MRLAISASTVLLAAGLAAAAPTIDGLNIPTDFTTPAIATQDTNTQFGNNFNELNQMFVESDTDNVYIGLTGNLADNNAIVVWIDTTLGVGDNVLSTLDPNGNCPGEIPTLVQMYSASTMEAGFSPTHALLISVGAFPGQGFDNLVMACDLVDLQTLTNTPLGLGILNAGSGQLSLTPDTGVELALDNSNTAGVGDYADGADPNDTGDDPASATSGVEVAIPRALLGLTGPDDVSVGFFAFLTNNAQGGGAGPCDREGFASNQGLPGIGGWGNLASFCPTCDFQLDFVAAPNVNFADTLIPGI
jgi:hypothetical protein